MDYKKEYELAKIVIEGEAKKDAFLTKNCWDKEEFEYYSQTGKIISELPFSLTLEELDELYNYYEEVKERELCAK